MPNPDITFPPEVYKALDQFNAREFFACHETLETLWIAEQRPVREIYQGIVNIAVGCYHLVERRNWNGAVPQLRKGINRLRRWPAKMGGVSLGILTADAERLLERLEQLGSERVSEFDPGLLPVVRYNVPNMAASLQQPDTQPAPAAPTTARSVAGATGIMMAAILASRLLGLVRDAVISGKFGQGFATDVYNAAFMIPDLLFFLIAGGALSSAFIPIFTEKITHGKDAEAWHIFSTVACVMVLVVGAFVVLGEVFATPLVQLLNPGFNGLKVAQTVPLTRIVLPAQMCFFLGGLMMGTQYARRQFLVPAVGPIIYNAGIILGGVLLTGSYGVAGLCWGALIGAFVGNLGLQWWAVRRGGMQFKASLDWRHPDVMRVWKMMLPVVLGLALPQVSIVINRMFASGLGDGPQSALMNANRLMQVPLGIFAQAMAVAIFPTLSALAARKEWAEMRSTASMGIRSILFLTIPSSVVLIVLATPIVRLLLQHGMFTAADTEATSAALVFYSIGIFAWSAQSILARGFYALQDSRTPVIIGTAVTLVFVPMNWLFMTALGMKAPGLALATTVAAVLHMIVMMIVLRRRLNGLEGRRMALSVAKCVAAAAIAGVACWAVRALLDGMSPATTGTLKAHALLTLCASGGVGGVVYLGMAALLRMEEMKLAMSMLRRKRRMKDEG